MKKLNRNQQSVIPRLLESSARGATRMRMFLMLMIMTQVSDLEFKPFEHTL